METAKASWELYAKHRPNKPVVAVIYTHSHVDHFGGVRGVVDEGDVKSGKVKIIAPEGFTEEAISENVFAGNAMMRRSTYSYGLILPSDATGTVGGGLGTRGSSGSVTLIPTTDLISKTGQKMTVDGVEFEFHLSGAQELRQGVKKSTQVDPGSPDVVRAMPVSMLLDFMAIKLDGPRAAKAPPIVLNLHFTDVNEQYAVAIRNGVLNYRKSLAAKPNASISLTKDEFNALIAGLATIDQLATDGKIKVEGDTQAFTQMLGLMDSFEFWFDIVTPNSKPWGNGGVHAVFTDAPAWALHAGRTSLRGGHTYSARLDHQTNSVPHLSKSPARDPPGD